MIQSIAFKLHETDTCAYIMLNDLKNNRRELCVHMMGCVLGVEENIPVKPSSFTSTKFSVKKNPLLAINFYKERNCPAEYLFLDACSCGQRIYSSKVCHEFL